MCYVISLQFFFCNILNYTKYGILYKLDLSKNNYKVAKGDYLKENFL